MVRGAFRLISLAVLFALAFAMVACGGSDNAGSSSNASPSGQAQSDSVLQAWPQAQEAVKEVADDAVLLAVGSGGLAFADVPDSWTFTFFSPSKKHAYVVSVEKGTAQPALDMGKTENDVEPKPVVAIESINVGGAEAVSLAREYGEKSGTVPKMVMVGGTFAETTGAVDSGIKTGIWTVTFATGTGMSDAAVFDVDMMSGEVTAAK